MATESRNIRVRYSTVDRFSKTGTFKTLAGAQRFAQKWVGGAPEISDTFGYAVSSSGTGKIECSGCDVRDLFPQRAALSTTPPTKRRIDTDAVAYWKRTRSRRFISGGYARTLIGNRPVYSVRDAFPAFGCDGHVGDFDAPEKAQSFADECEARWASEVEAETSNGKVWEVRDGFHCAWMFQFVD